MALFVTIQNRRTTFGTESSEPGGSSYLTETTKNKNVLNIN